MHDTAQPPQVKQMMYLIDDLQIFAQFHFFLVKFKLFPDVMWQCIDCQTGYISSQLAE